MLKLTTHQVAAMAVVMGRQFEQRLERHIREQFPDLVETIQAKDPENGLTGFVRTCIEHAERFDLDDDADCAIYVTLVLANARLGPGKAEVLAWTRDVFQRAETSGPLKVEWVLATLREMAKLEPDAEAVLGWVRTAEKTFAP